MARKSRKSINTLTKETNFTVEFNEKGYSVGAYVRLSSLDGNKKDSNTLENQKNIILDYIKDKEEFKLTEIYEDSNKTGTNFARSGFENLLDDIKKGKINCVIVKDLSRFGRNYIECSNYLEKVFPFINVRFIAINDNYDSNNENAKNILIMQLKNIVNETYAKDISKKIYTVLKEKQKKGDFVGSYPSYGYLKDSNNKNKIIVNKETAPIIKYIFDLRLKGYSYNKIALKLNDKNIFSPRAYLYEKVIKTGKIIKRNLWNSATVKSILSNEVYIGNMVQGRQEEKLFENQKRISLEKDKWIRVENTHEPIISKEIFYKVQEINQVATDNYNKNNEVKLIKNKSENIFKGIIKCGSCGNSLYRRERSKKMENGIYINKFFTCNYNKIYNCKLNSMNENTIKEIVFEKLKNQIQIAVDLENILIKNSNVISFEENKLNKEIEEVNLEISKIQNFYKGIYEDYVIGLLDEETYILTKNSYIKKEQEFIKTRDILENKLLNLKQNLSMENKFLKEFLKFKNSKILTRELAQTLIKEIVIYSDKSIKITFNYRNKPNLLLEEIERGCNYAKHCNVH